MSPPPSDARMTAARSGCVLDHRQTLRRNASRGGHAKAARTLSASTRRIRQGVPASASSSSAAGVAAALGGGVAAKSSLSHCHNRTAKRRVAPAKRSTSTLHRRRTTMLVPSPSSRPTRHDQRTNCQAPSAMLVVTAPRAWAMLVVTAPCAGRASSDATRVGDGRPGPWSGWEGTPADSEVQSKHYVSEINTVSNATHTRHTRHARKKHVRKSNLKSDHVPHLHL